MARFGHRRATSLGYIETAIAPPGQTRVKLYEYALPSFLSAAVREHQFRRLRSCAGHIGTSQFDVHGHRGRGSRDPNSKYLRLLRRDRAGLGDCSERVMVERVAGLCVVA